MTRSRFALRFHQLQKEFPVPRGIGILSVIQIAGLGIGYVSQILFARWVGPVEYGVYAFIIALTSLLAILPGLGLADAVLRLMPPYVLRGEWRRLRGLLVRGWQVTLGVGAILALGTWFVMQQLPLADDAAYANVLGIGVLLIPLVALLNLQVSIARSSNQIVSAYVPSMALRPLLLLGGAGVWFAVTRTLTAASLIAVAVVVQVVVLVCQLVLIRRSVPPQVVQVRAQYDTRNWLTISLPLMIAGLFVLAMNQMSVVIAGIVLGPAQAGFYNAALKTTGLLAFVLGAANAVAAPMMAALYAQGKRAALQDLALTVTRWGFGASLLGAIVLIGFSAPILNLFGAQFESAQPAILILTLGQLANTAMGPVVILLNMTGHQNQTMRVLGWSALLNVGLSVAGTYWFGLTGAAVADTVTIVVWNVWLYRTVVRRVGVDPSLMAALFGGRTLKS